MHLFLAARHHAIQYILTAYSPESGSNRPSSLRPLEPIRFEVLYLVQLQEHIPPTLRFFLAYSSMYVMIGELNGDPLSIFLSQGRDLGQLVNDSAH